MSITRREWLKLTGACLTLTRPLLALSQSCPTENIKDNEEAILLSDEQIIYWLDGPLHLGMGRMAILLRIKQSAQSYISRVTLTTDLKETIAVRYFNKPTMTTENYLPYLIFNRIDARFGKKYLLTVLLKDNSNEKIFRYVFDDKKLHRSKLSSFFLPPSMQIDLKNSHDNNVTSIFDMPLPYFNQANCPSNTEPRTCLAEHFPNIKLLNLNTNGQDGLFQINVSFHHPDRSPTHFIRYIVLTDPVGRIMSLYKRSYQDPKVSNNITLKALTPSERSFTYKIGPLDDPNINDCPYVMIFMDDTLEALTQTVLNLFT